MKDLIGGTWERFCADCLPEGTTDGDREILRSYYYAGAVSVTDLFHTILASPAKPDVKLALIGSMIEECRKFKAGLAWELVEEGADDLAT